MKKVLCSAMLVIAFTVAGCASGQKFAEMSSQIPALKKGEGRVYFIRAAEYQGSAVRPDIRLNGQVVGTSKPGGFFYVDRPAGDYTVTTSTEVERNVSFSLKAGETKYIRTAPSMGLLVGHITPTIEYPEQGQSEIRSLSYTGQ